MARYQIVRSKIKKTRVLQSDRQISKYIPTTLLYNKANLEKMLDQYPLVFVKPDCGRKGFRVAAVEKDDDNYFIYYNSKEILLKAFDKVTAFVKELSRGNRFLVQQGIKVLKIDQRLWSLRVWVQKPYESWEVTGITAAIAAPQKLVTNYRQGSTLVPFIEAVRKTEIKWHKIKELTELLYFIGEHSANVLTDKYPGIRELGVDIGLDQVLHPWIFEVNTRPRIIIGNQKIRLYHKIIIKNSREKYKQHDLS
ncbi:MAG: hypothetical protein CVU88_03545 [Firmicutes bacterium HGW-Firmicutes-13]|nr:MAG: hypothetical protein CVU88_03545 [Firmicutes bacterium HGW-Firmicutes-13]